MVAVSAEIAAAKGIVKVDFLQDDPRYFGAIENDGGTGAKFLGRFEDLECCFARQQGTQMSEAVERLGQRAIVYDQVQFARDGLGDRQRKIKAAPSHQNDFDSSRGGLCDGF